MTNLTPPTPATPYVTFAGEGAPLSTLSEEELVSVYKRHGAILLRGFNVDLSGFSDLTRRLCVSSVFNESPGREVIDANQNVQTVNLGAEAFPLHPELSREPWKPDICFFWCIEAPTNGGETTLCDGIEIVRNLTPAVREQFAARSLLHRQIATPVECERWLGSAEPDDTKLANPPASCPYTFERVNGKVLRSFVRPAFHKPMFSDEPAWGNFLLFARYLNRIRVFPTFENGELVSDALLDQVKAVSDQLEKPIPWQPGDIVILDNTRFMHGRRQITDVSERRIATYFGYVRFAEISAQERQYPWRDASFRPPRA
ncbi:MAG: TauD/TfdA family dioxygenase [Hyphomonadaceae bacterium]|nr:TauD/TfdA family dioxygenase [Hyphomonadaceae bacterium]